MKVSIITINFNNAAGLRRTVQSVVTQTCHDFEYVIIDGGSNDGSVDVIDEIPKTINLKWVSERDRGLYDAMNKGIDRSSGEYCIFMNSGDEFYDASVLEKVMPYLQSKVGVVSGIGGKETIPGFPVAEQQLNLTFFLKDSLNHQSAFVRRDILSRLHFSEAYKIVSDTELFFRALILDNESYEAIPIRVCKCEAPGASGDLKKSLEERYAAIKKLLPPRMVYDVDFIVRYHNPVVLWIGKILYNNFFRKMYRSIKNVKGHR